MKLERASRTIEYKREISDFKKIAQTTIAFANGIGGKIYVGIEDKSLKVIGVQAKELDLLLEKLPISLSSQISPFISPLIYTKTIEGKDILIIEVFPGYQKPYFLTSEGVENGTYIRVGPHTKKASGEALEELRLTRLNLSYDEALITNTSKKDLDLAILPASLRNEKSLFSLDILGKDPHTGETRCSRGGILMLCPTPEKYIPESEIIISKIKGTKGRDTIETTVLSGHIPSLSEQALDILSNWLGTYPVLKKGIYKNSALKIPIVALREAINNALLHRQYSIPGAIKIALYSDRLEIFNPGQFVGPFIPESLGDGTSYIRNKVICSVARRMGLIEKRGTGIAAIISSIYENQLKNPTFTEGPTWFKVSFYLEKFDDKVSNSAEDKIIKLANENNTFSSSDVCKLLSVSKATAVAHLDKLMALEKLEKIGNGPKTRYKLIVL